MLHVVYYIIILVCTCIYVCMYVCMYVHMYVCTYVHTYVRRTHTYICIQVLLLYSQRSGIFCWSLSSCEPLRKTWINNTINQSPHLPVTLNTIDKILSLIQDQPNKRQVFTYIYTHDYFQCLQLH